MTAAFQATSGGLPTAVTSPSVTVTVVAPPDMPVDRLYDPATGDCLCTTGTAPVEGFFYPPTSAHFYTTSQAEYSAFLGAGLLLQGTVGYLDSAG